MLWQNWWRESPDNIHVFLGSYDSHNSSSGQDGAPTTHHHHTSQVLHGCAARWTDRKIDDSQMKKERECVYE